jgi:hypothetical protein
MITIRLSPEYLAYPIFCSDLENMRHIDLEELPISSDLKSAIKVWDDEYQATFDSDYPPDSSFPTPEAKKAHVERGATLAKRLQEELGPTYRVEYKA